MIKAANALIKTAAADKSLIFRMVSCFSGEIKSDMFSIAELSNSIANTKPTAKITAIHSYLFMSKNTENAATTSAATRCILALCSSFHAVFSPLNA